MDRFELAPRPGESVYLPVVVPDFVLSPPSPKVLIQLRADQPGKTPQRVEDVLTYLCLVAAQADLPANGFVVDYESLGRAVWGPDLRPPRWQVKIKSLLARLGCYPEPHKGCPAYCGLKGAQTWHLHLSVTLPTDVAPLLPLAGPLKGTGQRPLYAPLLLLGRAAGMLFDDVRVLSAILSESRFSLAGEPRLTTRRRVFRFDGSHPLKGGSPLHVLLTKAMFSSGGYLDQDMVRPIVDKYLSSLVRLEEWTGLSVVVSRSKKVKCSASKALAFLRAREGLPSAAIGAWRVSITAKADFFTALKNKLQEQAKVILSPDYSPVDEKERRAESGNKPKEKLDQEELRRRVVLCLKEMKIKQTALAKRLQVTRRAVWGFVHGRTNFRETKAVLLHRWLLALGR
ncbi:MAG: hypothetical protein E6G97_18645 [Alphaproteobacteria bacterium]|nr:MAG: hypothetical protein E6G97_18645 [Alphaproteobacteria bacterium]